MRLLAIRRLTQERLSTSFPESPLFTSSGTRLTGSSLENGLQTWRTVIQEMVVLLHNDTLQLGWMSRNATVAICQSSSPRNSICCFLLFLKFLSLLDRDLSSNKIQSLDEDIFSSLASTSFMYV